MTLDSRHALSSATNDALERIGSVLDGVEPWLVASTSGSTGQSRRVALPATALRASSLATHSRLGGPGQWLLALPVDHIAGLQVLTRSLVAGIPVREVPLDEGFRPGSFVAAARTLTASRTYVSLVPTQLRRLLAHQEGTDALRTFHAVLLGGARTPEALLASAAAEGIRVVTTYGMTETSGGCVYDGVALDGVEVRVGDDGRIAIRGPVVAAGYLDQAGRLDHRLTSRFRTPDGWWLTNDAGRWLPGAKPPGSGETAVPSPSPPRIEVLGRLDDMIISGGVNVAPAAVEPLVQSWLASWYPAHAAPAEVCVVGLPDAEWGQRVVAVIAAAGAAPTDSDHDALRRQIREALGPAAVPAAVVLLDDLPRVGLGKVDRRAVQRAAQQQLNGQAASGPVA